MVRRGNRSEWRVDYGFLLASRDDRDVASIPLDLVVHMLSGKSAIVTGSTSGIGLGIARGLAANGANIMLNGFGDPNEIEAIRGEIANGRNIKVLYSNANMADGNDIGGMMALAEDEFGGVDILVNNAGIQYVAPIEDFPVEKWDAILAINLSSAFHASRLAIPGDEEKVLGPDRQHRIGACVGRLPLQVGLRRGQAWHRRLHQNRSA